MVRNRKFLAYTQFKFKFKTGDRVIETYSKLHNFFK